MAPCSCAWELVEIMREQVATNRNVRERSTNDFVMG
jgi:hypothetical protein